MDLAQVQGNRLTPRGPGNLEEENVWLQEWIHEELAHGEVWHKQYEALLERQARLCSLLQTKSFKPLEKKTQALQEELEEAQEALWECQNRSRQRQLHIHKHEKENQRMEKTVKELEKKVFKQQLEENSSKDILKELRAEGNEMKRHLSEWEATWQAKNDRIRQKQHQIEKLNTTIQGLSLRSQELHRSIALLEDCAMENQQDVVFFQKEVPPCLAEAPADSFLWEERACDQMKTLPCLELSRICFKGQLLPSISLLPPSLRAAWNLLWAAAKILLLLFLLTLTLHFLRGLFTSQPCAELPFTPLLYIQPKGRWPPLAS